MEDLIKEQINIARKLKEIKLNSKEKIPAHLKYDNTIQVLNYLLKLTK